MKARRRRIRDTSYAKNFSRPRASPTKLKIFRQRRHKKSFPLKQPLHTQKLPLVALAFSLCYAGVSVSLVRSAANVFGAVGPQTELNFAFKYCASINLLAPVFKSGLVSLENKTQKRRKMTGP